METELKGLWEKTLNIIKSEMSEVSLYLYLQTL